MAQIITQSLVLGFEFGQAHSITVTNASKRWRILKRSGRAAPNFQFVRTGCCARASKQLYLVVVPWADFSMQVRRDAKCPYIISSYKLVRSGRMSQFFVAAIE